MQRAMAVARQWLVGGIVAAAAVWAQPAAATDVRFVGSVGYSHLVNIVLLASDQIKNFSTAPSGALRMELWATPAPFAGSFAGGIQLATYGVAPLAAGAAVTNVESGTLPWNEPPAAWWYVTMVLTEDTGAGYVPRSWLGFPDKILGNGGGGTPADTTPPTVGIPSPTGGNVSGTVAVTANASDNVGVTRVDFYVNGALSGSDVGAPYQYSWNTTALANGNATLRAVAFDAAGNSAQSANVTVTIANVVVPPPDTTPPTVGIASPTGGNVSGTVTVAANASDNVGVTRVDFYVNGALSGSDVGAPYQYSWNTTALANGNATLRAVAFDAAGNSAQSANVTVTIANVVVPPPDTTPPTVGIASPTGGNVSGTVTVTANASDNVGVTRVDFYVNGALSGSDVGAPYQYSWNTTALANGNATLRAVAFDAAGNSAQSANVTVTIANVVVPPPDTTPPTVGIASPTGGSVSGTVTVAANASDNVGVTRVDFYVNGALLGSDGTAPYQYSWNTAALANGNATLRAVAFDAAGNSGQSANVAVTVNNVVVPPPDTTPPTVGIASPTGGSVSGTVTVAANASDNVGVTRVDFYVNGALLGSDGTAPYQYSWNTAALANGNATLRAVAFDAAGNSAQSANVTVTIANLVTPTVDVVPPVVTLLSPTGGSVSGKISVTASATDNVGVARVDLMVNGLVVASTSKAPWRFTWNSRSAADGGAQLQLAATDAAGNRATSGSVTVVVTNAGGRQKSLAVEYYHAEFDHYFITAMPEEIIALDSGRFSGWSRTGSAIDVYDAGTADGAPVCRFYIPPQRGNSHFYSASSDECEGVAARYPDFAYESTEVFRVDTPDAETGQCPPATVPVYRVWNNRFDSNHRYTTDRTLRDQMVAKGYLAEGFGPDKVMMCTAP